MTSTRTRVTTAIAMALLALPVQGQSPSPPASAATPGATLPRLSDWFLSTGTWEKDPQLYVREVGSGSEPIVMLHGGWGAEHSGLITAVQGLEDQYRFVFYDQRGSLRSPSPDALISFDQHVDDLELLRQELNLDTMHVVGHSMGAILASAYASKYPGRIKQLTLVSPALLKNPLSDTDNDVLRRGQPALKVFIDRPEVIRELDKYALNRTDPPLSSREETIKFRINLYKRMLYDIGNWRALMGGRALFKSHVGDLTVKTYPKSGWNYVEEFGRRPYPVAIIVGDHDFIDFGNHLFKAWVQSVPRIDLTIIERAGHFPWVDQREAFTKALRRHLDRR
jgi:proline iminopeptidase